MPSAHRSGPCALVFVLLASASPAAAADSNAVRDAQARFAEGLARVKSGDYEAARLSFVQAYVVLHKPDILWNLALAEEKSAHPLDALKHFKELTLTAAADVDRANAQKHVATLMGQTGHIDVKAPSGIPLTVDGVQGVATTPLAEPLDVAPGRHVVEGKLAEGTKSATVDVAAGEVATATLTAGESATSTSTSTATSTSTPTPTSTPTSTPSPGADASSLPTSEIITAASLGVAGFLAIGAGAYFGLQSQSDASNAAGYRSQYGDSHCVNPANKDCGAWNDAVKAQNRDATISNVAYVGGGVLVAGAAAAWLFWPKPSTNASAWVVPAIGPSGGGVGVGGRF